MITDIKTGFRLLKYGYAWKASVICLIVQIMLGVILYASKEMYEVVIGIFTIISAPLWLLQVFISIGLSNMVQTSVWKKKMEISVSVFFNMLFSFIMYLILLGIELVQLMAGVTNSRQVAAELMIAALLFLVIMIYNIVAYKLFYMSIVLVFISMLGITVFINPLLFGEHAYAIPLWIGVVSCLFSIGIGGGASYVMAKLLYHVPLSKVAQFAGLRKQL